MSIKKLISACLCIAFLVLCSISVRADVRVNPYGDPIRIRATVYDYTGSRCSNGEYPQEGITLAGKSEWKGKTCIMYACNSDGSIGDVIGIFEFEDTGGYYIRSGKRIDVYRETEQGCNDWIATYGDYVYMQIIDAEG